MASPNQEKGLREIANALSDILPEVYGEEMGFMVLIAPMNNPGGLSDYIGNASRETSIKWLRETAERLEANQDIAASMGEG